MATYLIWLKFLKAGIAQKSAADLALGAVGFGLAGASATFAVVMIANNDGGPRVNAADKLAIFAQPASTPYNGGYGRSARAQQYDMTPVGTVRARTSHVPAPPAEKTVDGYRMRGYSQGEALVQGPEGFVNVKVGSEIDGLGRVTGFEARGRNLVIITTGGVIGADD